MTPIGQFDGVLRVERPEWEDVVALRLGEKRIVVLHGQIEEVLAQQVSKELLYMESVGPEPIRVILNSVGGDVYDGLLIFDTIRDIAKKGIEVTIEVRGLAASMAAIILQAASIKRRTSSRYTRFLIHEISSLSAGTTSEQEEQVNELRKLNSMLRDILSERTGRSVEEIEKMWKKTDVWFSADEALKFGLVDEVL